MAPKRTKKVQILTEFYDLTPWGRQGGPLGSPPQKKIIKILKAAFWFSVKALADSAALSLYTLIDHRRVSYIYIKYIRNIRSTFDGSQNRARLGRAVTVARSSL